MKFDNNEICSIFPIDSSVIYVWDQILIFWEKRVNSGQIFYMSSSFFWAKSLQKTCPYIHEKLQWNFSVSKCLIFIFQLYGFDYLGFLTNARRGAMRSKPQWVFYRDLDWGHGPQKVQFREITGYPEVVELILAMLRGWLLVLGLKEGLVKVSKSQKQIMASWILPKNEHLVNFQYTKLPQRSFLGRIQDNIFLFQDFLTFRMCDSLR